MEQRRLYEIDLFRFLAALMVVFFHYAFRGYAADHLTSLPYPLLASLAKYGYLGVDLFFIVSGFVILMTVSNGSPKRFVISRMVRLYPAFWICCTATFLVTKMIGGMRYQAGFFQYLANMTLFSSFFNITPIDGVYWSLYVEMKFYFLIFIMLILRIGRYAESLLGLWLICTIVLTKWHIFSAHHISGFFIPQWSAYFIAGAMFYRIYASGVSFFRMFIVFVSYLLAIRLATWRMHELASHYSTAFDPLTGGIIISIFFLIFFLVATKRTGWLATSRWIFFGGLTYPLYLIHHNVGFMLFNVMYPFLNVHFIFWVTLLVMLFIAYAVNQFVEIKYSGQLKIHLERWLKWSASETVRTTSG